MTIKVRKISKSEVPKKVKIYRPELSQQNGNVAETLASLLGMSIGDIVNQILEKAENIELISEKKNLAISLNGPIGEMGQKDFDEILATVEDYEKSLEESKADDDKVGSESSEQAESEDLGKSKTTAKSSHAVAGIGSSVLGDDDDDLNLEEGDDLDEDEDLEEAANNI